MCFPIQYALLKKPSHVFPTGIQSQILKVWIFVTPWRVNAFLDGGFLKPVKRCLQSTGPAFPTRQVVPALVSSLNKPVLTLCGLGEGLFFAMLLGQRFERACGNRP
jgi:hypothetical protein